MAEQGHEALVGGVPLVRRAPVAPGAGAGTAAAAGWATCSRRSQQLRQFGLAVQQLAHVRLDGDFLVQASPEMLPGDMGHQCKQVLAELPAHHVHDGVARLLIAFGIEVERAARNEYCLFERFAGRRHRGQRGRRRQQQRQRSLKIGRRGRCGAQQGDQLLMPCGAAARSPAGLAMVAAQQVAGMAHAQ